MLTIAELASAREKLSQAQALVSSVKDAFFAAGDTSGARLLNEVIHALGDEIAAIDKKTGAKQ